MLRRDTGGVAAALIEGAESIRLTAEALRPHARRWGLPEGQAPLHGLLGVPLRARDGATTGMLLAADKAHGDFDAEDEALLAQLATVAALALQHVEARLALEESDRRKDAFLAMLGHELRNPLAPIRNSLYILERAPPGGELALRAKRRSTARSRTSRGWWTTCWTSRASPAARSSCKREPSTSAISCGAPWRTIAGASRRAASRWRSRFPQAPLWVSADRTRLAQVIGNLLGNAAKFTPAGGEVAVSLEATPSGQAVLVVRDTGIGIAPEMLAQVFEPFTQADTTLARSRGGFGLGLAMVKGLVELHGGHASVASAGPGAGTAVTVRLPLEAAAPAEEPAGERPAPGGAPRRVLVIEDNSDAAESLRMLLELRGHTVAVARTGAEGVAEARTFAPDVILCDIGLPGMDGYAVARTLRADPQLQATRIVALSGYAAPEDIAKGREAGFDAHLAKPPSLDTLEAVLSNPRRDDPPR
jgi:signal transduction histidine kinase/ActR/RegA family two-component response regulator